MNTQEPTLAQTQYSGREAVALVPVGIALNLAIGTLVHALKLPIYLDAVGTVAITLIAGLRPGLLVGVLSFVVGAVLINPVMLWFSGTQAAIALYVHAVAKQGAFRTYPRTIVAGIGLGVVAAIVSAPVLVVLFGGITGSGSSLIVAFLLASGKGLMKAVIFSGLASEPLDKTLQCVLAIWLVRGLPRSVTRRFKGGSLAENSMA
jgi:energy-coupling factor transport system substrate-specific component